MDEQTVKSNAPDLLALHGALPTTPNVAQNATLAAFYRTGQPFKGDLPFIWKLNFEKGEVRFTSESGLFGVSSGEGVKLELHDFSTDEVKDVAPAHQWNDEQKKLPGPARDMAESLYAFAKGDEKNYVTLEDALERAKQVDGWLKGN